jgi:thiol-disulfide isomerase/thioredoxin
MSSKFVNFNSSGNTSNFLSKIKIIGGGINRTTYILISLLILFAIIAFVYYYYYVLPKLKTNYKPNNELLPSDNSTNTAELLFFFTDWCPHCKTAKPIWQQLKDEYNNKTINGYNILFTEIDCSQETDEVDKMMNKYSVEGYPTIKLLKDGQVIEYDAKPSKETLTQFLNTVL